MSNVYYEPEQFGLAVVGSFEFREPDWSFDIFAVWKDVNGQFYYATSSGCSCPTPFEEYSSIEELTAATSHEVAATIVGLIADHGIDEYESESFRRDMTRGAADLIVAVMSPCS